MASVGATGSLGYATSAGEEVVAALQSATAPLIPGQHSSRRKKLAPQDASPAGNQYAGDKCLISHHEDSDEPEVIWVSRSAVPAHLEHGDTVIFCED